MRRIRLIAALAAAVALGVLVPRAALAQPGQPHPPPPSGGQGYGQPPNQPYYQPPPVTDERGFFLRRGLTLGGGIGLGGMSSDSNIYDCFDCDYHPIALSLHGHIGGMITPRFALMFEGEIGMRTLDADGVAVLAQSSGMLAGQFWITPQLWIKGGLGVSHLEISVASYYYDVVSPQDNGATLMAAVGYDVLASLHFTIDLQLRGSVSTYDGIDEQIGLGTIGVGFNWF